MVGNIYFVTSVFIVASLALQAAADPKRSHYIVKDKTNKHHLVVLKEKKGDIKSTTAPKSRMSNDYSLSQEHFDEIDQFEKDMFPAKFHAGGNDYSMGADPDTETFIIKDEKPIMQGCRIQF